MNNSLIEKYTKMWSDHCKIICEICQDKNLLLDSNIKILCEHL